MKNKFLTTTQILILSLLILTGMAILPLLHNHPPNIFTHNHCPVSIIEKVLSGFSVVPPVHPVLNISVPEFISDHFSSPLETNPEYPSSLKRAPPFI